MRNTLTSLVVLLAVSLFAFSAFAQTRTAAEAPAELTEEDGEGSGEDVQAMPGPAPRIATTANEERQVEEPNEGNEDDGESQDPRYGSGGN